jgi:AraC-like DNA-binding protein
VSDFASASMLRMLHAGMRRLGLQSPAQQWLAHATVPLDAKQQLVMQVMQHQGAAALLQLGQGVHEMQHDSLVPLLIHMGDPLRMLASWLRLERYLHSKHRIKQTVLHPCCVLHQHISIRAGTAPNAAEDLVVLGVLIALLQSTGCDDVDAALENGTQVWPIQHAPEAQIALQLAFENRHTHSWRISWRANQTLPAAARTKATTNFAADTNLSQRLQSLLSQTHDVPLSVADAAQRLGQSTRSLQRHLHLEGVRYVDMVATARAQCAAHLLAKPVPSLAEIGFSCGYTDQAHFCRDFKRRVGISPLRYRENSQR